MAVIGVDLGGTKISSAYLSLLGVFYGVGALGIALTWLALSQILKKTSPSLVVFIGMLAIIGGALLLEFGNSFYLGLAGIAMMGTGLQKGENYKIIDEPNRKTSLSEKWKTTGWRPVFPNCYAFRGAVSRTEIL